MHPERSGSQCEVAGDVQDKLRQAERMRMYVGDDRGDGAMFKARSNTAKAHQAPSANSLIFNAEMLLTTAPPFSGSNRPPRAETPREHREPMQEPVRCS